MENNIKNQILNILSEQAEIDISQIKLSSTPKELGLDSLNLIEIIFAIEENFNVSIPFNANDPTKSTFNVENVGSIIQGIENLVKSS